MDKNQIESAQQQKNGTNVLLELLKGIAPSVAQRMTAFSAKGLTKQQDSEPFGDQPPPDPFNDQPPPDPFNDQPPPDPFNDQPPPDPFNDQPPLGG